MTIFRKHSLATTFIFEISGLVLAISLLMGIVISNSVKADDELQIESTLLNRAEDAAKLVDMEIERQIKQVEDIAERPDIKSMDWAVQKEVLISEAKRIGFERFQVGDLNGDVISTTDDKANAGDRPFYKSALAKVSNISDVLFARIDLKMVNVVSSAITDKNGTVLGVLSGVSDASKLTSITDGINLDYEGFCFVINNSGQKMAGVDYTGIEVLENDLDKKDDASMASFIKAQEEMISKKKGITSYSQNGSEYYLAFAPINDGAWILGLVQDKASAMAHMDVLIKKIFAIAISFIVAGVIVGLFMGMPLRPIKKVSFAINDIANGDADLTKQIQVDALAKNNEIGTMIQGFNGFVGKLRSIIGNVKDSKNELVYSGNQLDRCVEDSSHAIKDIINDISNIGSHIQEQSNAVEETAGAVTEIAQNIDSLDKMIQAQSSSVVQASAAVEQMICNITSVDNIVAKMSLEFSNLEKESTAGVDEQVAVNENVSKIAQQSALLLEANAAIASIAEQTNMLAMNAAIEAAHAGEAGKGFSVVADEIRKLSETSSAQSQSIGQELNQIIRTIEDVVSSSNASEKTFMSLSDKIREINNLVREISASMNEQQQGSKQISDTLKIMNNSSIQVHQASQEMAEGNKAILEEINILQNTSLTIKDCMRTMSGNADSINQTSSSLSEMSLSMKDSIDKISQEIDLFRV